jgi:hypothetical protein
MKRSTYKVTSLSDRHALIRLSDRVALITQSLKRPGRGGRKARLIAGYVGFDSYAAAAAFVQGIRQYFPKCFCEIRTAQRLTTAIEVKSRYSFEGLEALLWSYSENPAIVATAAAPLDASAAKASIYPMPSTPIASPTAGFVDRSSAPLMIGRSKPQMVGRLAIE